MLSDEQRTLHDRVIQLRNNAIAHFGFGHEHPEGPLIREALVLSLTPPGPRPIFHASWAMNKARFTADFGALVDHVQQIAMERASDRMNEVISEIARIGSTDASLKSAIERHPFDADVFFVSSASRAEMYVALQGNSAATLHVPTLSEADENER